MLMDAGQTDSGAGVGIGASAGAGATVDAQAVDVEMAAEVLADSIFERICSASGFEQGQMIEYYQFVAAVLDFVADNDNFAELFSSMSSAERQKELKLVLVCGIDAFFPDNQEYREFVDQLFDGTSSVGTVSVLVLSLMEIVQSAVVHGKIEGSKKHEFVKQSVKALLSFTDMSDADQMLANATVDLLIRGFIKVKHGALGAKAQEIAKKVSKCWCW